MTWHRVWALLTRHLYVYRRSPVRLVEMVYWPLLDLLLWGFLSLYLKEFGSGVPQFVAFFIGALIFWDILYRAQQGISIAYLEEVWSRNLLNLFVSPLTPGEFAVGTILISLIKVLFTTVVMTGLALLLYAFNLFDLGPALLPFIFNLLVMGWSVGILTTSLIMRWGQAAENLAWALAFLFQPISAVFYPISVLPAFLQTIAQAVPAAHVFEGMRAVIQAEAYPAGHLLWAFGLNLIYVVLAVLVYQRTFAFVRERGLLAKVGE